MDELFPIGKVAKMFRLSVSSLRHYEAVGILIPEKVDPDTGYRYYSVRQFEVLNTIRYLRMLDMPIAEIADFLGNRDIDRIEEKLRQQKAAVVRKQQEFQMIERKIDNRLRQLSDASHSELNRIREIHTPAQRIIWDRSPLRVSSWQDMENPIRRLTALQDEALVFLGKVGLGITAGHLMEGRFSEYDGIFLLPDKEDKLDGESDILPEADCVSVRFNGSHGEAASVYRKLMEYMGEHGLTPDGFSREVTLIDQGVTGDPEKFVTEISIPFLRSPKG